MSKPTSPIYVVSIIDDYTIVINKGSDDGIMQNHKFLIYSISDEPIIDPITKLNLGYLEIVKGVAEVKHLQHKICTLESSKYTHPTKRIRKHNNSLVSAFGSSSSEEIIDDKEQLPFENLNNGDYAKLV
ncbi:hypothetical protein LL033_10040 [Clostridium estertheticum]|uniref:hypothetical protein n=1 Tax=Clostridium estertheticum TaxID=238834 RepID=UPI001C0D9311|nr:hypothetical protein [Clostridium estertheticum]MBU3217808.1 hypothetical protein [Clostridium estertheticum]WAG57495.1 hypothetical protein LL033_10040 [Clostridium estertheticum]